MHARTIIIREEIKKKGATLDKQMGTVQFIYNKGLRDLALTLPKKFIFYLRSNAHSECGPPPCQPEKVLPFVKNLMNRIFQIALLVGALVLMEAVGWTTPSNSPVSEDGRALYGPPEKGANPVVTSIDGDFEKEREKKENGTAVSDPITLAGLPVPEGFEGRVYLWKTVYGEYDNSRFVFYHLDYPGIIYEVTTDYPGDRERAVARIRTKLYAIHHILKDSADPIAEIERREDGAELLELYGKFREVPGENRFAIAARRNNIGVLRGRKNELKKALIKAGPYLPAMEQEFLKNGVPPALTRLVFVESMFDRRARSSVGAVGVWQLMPSAASRYLVMTDTIDQRRDPLASSRAAAKILKSNHQLLGNWPLAVTAYNAGQNRMKRAVKHTNTTHLPDVLDRYNNRAIGYAVENFYARVLGVIAAEKMLAPDLPDVSMSVNPVGYDVVSLPERTTVADLSNELGMDEEILVMMNPAWTYSTEKSWLYLPEGYLLRVPEGSQALVKLSLGIEDYEASAGFARPSLAFR